jgi:hypothetical protein
MFQQRRIRTQNLLNLAIIRIASASVQQTEYERQHNADEDRRAEWKVETIVTR